jgi:uncharacterized membrane protein YbjE (DUF340 family)
MINSLKILLFFVIGVFLGFFFDLPRFLTSDKFILYLLYFLILFVGFSIGASISFFEIIKKIKISELFFPFGIAFFSIFGGVLSSIFFNDISYKDGASISAGFGYYSLSTILITEIKGEYLGTIALLSNIIREISTFLFSFIIVKKFSPLSPIAIAGATSMDTTMPLIMKTSGKKYILLSIYNGIILSSLVPIITPIILS